ncbi:cell division protein ZipA [Colwellia sp. C1TZA3]|uniref:cell division protein ZipA n=1 Tax=Colwellia sp. C1TZA3 TaxID=2508879 RepID=UPI0011B9931C|nr:cell division protein ZipA [Colwellia sp. C1TZA3]TWX73626.1 cell division protein ZipA [Colwellia sp. C1TZA3]
MEDNFRNTLIIISAIVIIAIFIHGYWTIRKQKNPYKLKTKVEPVTPQSRGFDGSGFDQDGVSKPKVVSASEQDDELAVKSHRVDGSADFYSEAPMPTDVPAAAFDEQNQDQKVNFGALHNDTEAVPEHLKQQALSDTPDYQEDGFEELADNQSAANKTATDEANRKKALQTKPVYQQPVTQAKPDTLVNKTAMLNKDVHKPKVKGKQLETNLSDEAAKNMPNQPATPASEKSAAINIEPQVIVLSVVMPKGEVMSGAALLPTLLTLGMKYGEMNIFHRHQDNAGNGKVTFSLANMMNPGTFNLDDIENFSTQGITLFMTLPNPVDAFSVFEQMLNAAKQLAVEFRAQLLDHKRSVMTKQTEQHYISLIREFERKSRIGSK